MNLIGLLLALLALFYLMPAFSVAFAVVLSIAQTQLDAWVGSKSWLFPVVQTLIACGMIGMAVAYRTGVPWSRLKPGLQAGAILLTSTCLCIPFLLGMLNGLQRIGDSIPFAKATIGSFTRLNQGLPAITETLERDLLPWLMIGSVLAGAALIGLGPFVLLYRQHRDLRTQRVFMQHDTK